MNWSKELIDQPLHFLWSGLATLAIVYAARSWQPDQTWQLRALYSLLIGIGVVNLAIIGAREAHQKRHLPDGILTNFPWLDATAFYLGAGIFACLGLNIS